MKLSKEIVEHVSRLARLRLTEEEEEKFSRQLGAVLEYMEILNKVKTEHVSLENPASLSGKLREDEPRPWPNPERLVKNSPESEAGFFKVKKVL